MLKEPNIKTVIDEYGLKALEMESFAEAEKKEIKSRMEKEIKDIEKSVKE